MRTFQVSVIVQIPTEELPLDKVVDDDFVATVFNKAMQRIEDRGFLAVDIVEKIVGEPDKALF